MTFDPKDKPPLTPPPRGLPTSGKPKDGVPLPAILVAGGLKSPASCCDAEMDGLGSVAAEKLNVVMGAVAMVTAVEVATVVDGKVGAMKESACSEELLVVFDTAKVNGAAPSDDKLDGPCEAEGSPT